MAQMVHQIQSMIDYVGNARDATLLVRRANAAGRLIDEALKTCRLMAEDQFELRQLAAEAHLRTQRRAGELLSELPKHQGGRPPKASRQTGGDQPLTLRELGINIHESHRWQRIASIPDEAFEQHIAESRSRRREMTTRRVVALAERVAREQGPSDGRAGTDGASPLVAEYDRVTRAVAELVWLDPAALAADMEPYRRVLAVEQLQRLRSWLSEFEQALTATSSLSA
jgi:hypothetical protein